MKTPDGLTPNKGKGTSKDDDKYFATDIPDVPPRQDGKTVPVKDDKTGTDDLRASAIITTATTFVVQLKKTSGETTRDEFYSVQEQKTLTVYYAGAAEFDPVEQTWTWPLMHKAWQAGENVELIWNYDEENIDAARDR